MSNRKNGAAAIAAGAVALPSWLSGWFLPSLLGR